jgi:hypothetical protein
LVGKMVRQQCDGELESQGQQYEYFRPAETDS